MHAVGSVLLRMNRVQARSSQRPVGKETETEAILTADGVLHVNVGTGGLGGQPVEREAADDTVFDVKCLACEEGDSEDSSPAGDVEPAKEDDIGILGADQDAMSRSGSDGGMDTLRGNERNGL